MKDVFKKPEPLSAEESAILEYIEDGIREKTFKRHERNYYLIHISRFLNPCLREQGFIMSHSKVRNMLKKLKKKGVIKLRVKVWEIQNWECGFKLINNNRGKK